MYKFKNVIICLVIIVFSFTQVYSQTPVEKHGGEDNLSIRIYSENPFYWEYKGNPVEEGTRRFWRSVFAGCASVRFHRDGPSYQFFGIGLTELAQVHIKSMRMLTSEMDFFNHKPANHLLADREANEAYCLAADEKEYAVYFPQKGEVMLNVFAGKYEARWLNISNSHWNQPETLELPGKLITPSDDHWAVFFRKTE